MEGSLKLDFVREGEERRAGEWRGWRTGKGRKEGRRLHGAIIIRPLSLGSAWLKDTFGGGGGGGETN